MEIVRVSIKSRGLFGTLFFWVISFRRRKINVKRSITMMKMNVVCYVVLNPVQVGKSVCGGAILDKSTNFAVFSTISHSILDKSNRMC
ncbi:hypothetical protein BVG16_01365 [Paenibacillus selenitireducens]|uniref:Uncharacterized protein n=1 Tax=Paenibacillus selenitireducens TaxID=1324314 RepID=A0A1T2XMC9_9BACL|nr:hypothetical protein BVG16_01365 [Paenibacillus selenitireducens]